MKFASSPSLVLALLSLFAGLAAGAAAAETPSFTDEIVALEKKLVAARDEVTALKTALAISRSETAAAEARATALLQTDSQLDTLRRQVRILERDLQSATTALKLVAADKAAAEAALAATRQEGGGTMTGSASAPAAAVRAGAPESPTVDPRVTELQAELTQARSQLAAAGKNLETHEAELGALREKLATAESQPRIPPSVTAEFDQLRQQVTAARELEARVRELETENTTLRTRLADAGGTREEFSRITSARADAERELAALHDALTAVRTERDELHAQASRAGELESRVRQLEAENARAPAETSGVSKEEFDRVVAARAEAELKLSTALRSYTLLTKERNELRARLAALTAGAPESQEKR